MNKISWNEQQGNKYVRRLSPEMLTSEVLHTSNPRLLGQPKTKALDLYYVAYDRSYVLHWIVKLLIIPLGIERKKDLDQLMIEAWNLHREKS